MRFGQHQGFYLRVNWLSKAIRMLNEDVEHERFFYDEFGFERIGLGRNMVKSLKYWALATQVIKEGKNEGNKSIHVMTDFGRLLYDHDRFIRLPLTSAILHYFLVSNKEQATAWYWYFNEYSQRSSSGGDVLESLIEWVQQHHYKSVSPHSLKKDLDCLKLMYTLSFKHLDDPEEVVASPFARLQILHDTKDLFIKKSPELDQLGIDALYFTLLVYCDKYQVNSVTLEEIQVKALLWGKIYNLTSNQILEAMDYLESSPLYPVIFVRTNQIYNLTIEVEDPYLFLEKAYQRKAAL